MYVDSVCLGMTERPYGNPDAEERRDRIVSYLRKRAEAGQSYFKSKLIGQDLGMSSRQVGANIAEIQEEYDDIIIEKNSRSRAICWRVELP
jgi:hypothetical protein